MPTITASNKSFDLDQVGQAALARRLGLHPSTICKVFSGAIHPSWETGKQIADELGITMDDLYQAIRSRHHDRSN